MSRSCSILLCGLFIAACERPQQSVSIPDDIAYVVVAELDEAGQVARLSPLGAWTPGVTVVSRGAPFRLLGYTAEQLAPFGVTTSTLPAAPLQVAVDCRTPLLPSPQIQLERIDGEWTPRAASTDLKLTAPFVEAVCADLDLEQVDDWHIDERCSRVPYCAAKPTVVSRCAVSFDLDECGGGRIEVSIGPTGEVCTEILDRAETCTQRAAPDGLVGFACTDDCRIDLYRDARTIDPPFSVEYIEFANNGPRTPPAEARSTTVRAEKFRSHYGQSMISVGDQIIIASNHADGYQCRGAPQFIYIDPVTLDMSTSTAPACMWSLVPFEDGFFGAHENPDLTWMLSRFDRQGRVERTIPLVLDGQGQDQWKPESLFISQDGTSLVAVMANYSYGRPGTGIIVVATDDLTIQRSELVAGSSSTFGITPTDGAILTTQVPTGDVMRIDPIMGAISAETIAMLPSELLYRPLVIDEGRTLVGSGENAGVFVIDAQGTVVGVSHPGRALQQSVFALSPFTDNTYLAFGAEQDIDGRQAMITLFDAQRLRFQPGVWPIGHGIATDIVRHAGRTFVLLPWIGRVAVIAPKP
ncbi:MAG: hypothetical protein AAFN74_19175 [Myxococcota bacterium]